MESLFQRVLNANPFALNAVSEPGTSGADVASIHQRAFDDLVACAEEVHRERGHAGHVVWGEAGIGKSHLLARLYHWAEADRAHCVFLHNIQPSPEWLARYVVKCVIYRLTSSRRSHFRETPLYRLVHDAVRCALDEFPAPTDPPTVSHALAAYRRLVDHLLAESPSAGVESRAAYDVLFRYFYGAYRRYHWNREEDDAALAVRWLSGDALERGEAAKLALPADDDPDRQVSLAGAPAVESVLLALAELAWLRGRPLILCFDQIDNLSRDQVRALTQFLHPLIDHSRNLLVVVSGVQRKILDFVEDGSILQAAWERIAQDAQGIQLTRIAKSQARSLLVARLDQFFRPLETLPELERRRSEDELFPLGTSWFEDRTRDLLEFRPRDVINWARDRWRRQQAAIRERGGPAWFEAWLDVPAVRAVEFTSPQLSSDDLARRTDAEIGRQIDEQIRRREQEPETLPPDAANLCGLAAALLSQCIGREPYGIAGVRADMGRPGHPVTYHLHVAGADDSTTGATFIATESATSSAAILRRLINDPEPPERAVLVYDERQPLKLGAAGEGYLEELRQRGPERFREFELSLCDHAELDAMQKVIGDARTGDLEIDLPGGASLPIAESEAVASLHRQNRFCRHPLLRLLLNR